MGDNNKMICRVCEATEDLCDLFAKENEDLLVMLESVANIYLHVDDFLPKQICADCVIRLKNAYAFKIQCETTEQKLREEYSGNQSHDQKDELLSDEIVMEYLEEELASVNDEEERTDHKIENRKNCSSFDTNIPKEEVSSDVNDSSININLDPLEADYIATEDSDKDAEIIPIKNSPAVRKYRKRKQAQKHEKDGGKSRSSFLCQFCSESFHHRIKFEEHVIKEHSKKPYPCPTCRKAFNRPSHLELHQQLHGDGEKREFFCEFCNRKYFHPQNLSRHIRSVHRQIKNYICEICGKGFARKEQLKQHGSLHIEKANHACDQCDKKYKTERQLSEHKKLHDPILRGEIMSKRAHYYRVRKSIVHECPECGQRFGEKVSLSTHMNKHTGARPFGCQTCGKRFTSLGSLRTHRRTHEENRPYRCAICGNAYRQSSHLKRHQQIQHSDDMKPFKCDHCTKAFTSNYTLQVHRRIHTGERPFKCPICDKDFIDSAVMRKHKLQHEIDGEKTKSVTKKEAKRDAITI